MAIKNPGFKSPDAEVIKVQINGPDISEKVPTRTKKEDNVDKLESH